MSVHYATGAGLTHCDTPSAGHRVTTIAREVTCNNCLAILLRAEPTALLPDYQKRLLKKADEHKAQHQTSMMFVRFESGVMYISREVVDGRVTYE